MMRSLYLGIDTSNYTTSLCLTDDAHEVICDERILLPVAQGEMGLRQSDALFHHTRQLPLLMRRIEPYLKDGELVSVGVSERPRRQEGSYMPCFLAGVSAAEAISVTCGIPLHRFTHQCGHIMAAVAGAKEEQLLLSPFCAFHVSGGTTEVVRVTYDGNGFLPEIVGGTRDLHAGQAVDRVGGMLGLSFPAGPALEKIASTYRGKIPKKRIITEDGYCHLSGLENQAKKLYEDTGDASEVAAFVLSMIAQAIVGMSRDVRSVYPDIPLLYAGGVMSNFAIRNVIMHELTDVRFAPPRLSSDNAYGIAVLTQLAHQRRTV